MDPNTSPVNDDQPQWSPASPPVDPQPLDPVMPPPAGAFPAQDDPSLAWPMPPGGFAAIAHPPPSPTSRMRQRLILTAAIGGTVLVILCAIGLHEIFGRVGTTKSFELVSPPPATVAGFIQDVTAERVSRALKPASRASSGFTRAGFTSRLPTVSSRCTRAISPVLMLLPPSSCTWASRCQRLTTPLTASVRPCEGSARA